MRKEYDFSKGKRGAIVPPSPRKTRITIRIDTKTLDWFRQRIHEAGGGNYQTMINDVLKDFIDRQNIKNKMTDLMKTIGTMAGTITLSSGTMAGYGISSSGGLWTDSMGRLTGQQTYVMTVGQSRNYESQKEDDEKIYTPLAACG